MAMTIQQFRFRFAKFGATVGTALVQGFTAGLQLAMKDAKYKFIGSRGRKGGITLVNRSGKLRGSIRIIAPKKEGSWFVGGLMAGSSRVPYARIHEMGGTTHPRVTAKMRRFAWAKYRETGKSMWKGLALTKKKRLTIHIKRRPYLNPALKRQEKRIRQNIVLTLDAAAAGHLAR